MALVDLGALAEWAKKKKNFYIYIATVTDEATDAEPRPRMELGAKSHASADAVKR